MYKILIIVLILLLSISVIQLYCFKNELKKIKNKISTINIENTNEKVRVSIPNKHIEELVLEINNCLEGKKETERKYKKLEIEIRQSIANISHDLRTPLTSIIGYIQLIKDEDINEEEKKEYIEVIEKRSQSLQMLITGFYDLSRLQASEFNFNYEKVNISYLLCDLIAAFYEDFINKGIEPVVEIDEKVPSIMTDKNAVNRIFTNLIQNILKHAEKKVIISLKEEGRYIITEFKNSTSEFKEEDIKNVFDRFFTGDRVRTGQNTGLGLAITKALVEGLENEIEAEYENGYICIRIKWNKN